MLPRAHRGVGNVCTNYTKFYQFPAFQFGSLQQVMKMYGQSGGCNSEDKKDIHLLTRFSVSFQKSNV